jgi:hypothetical protein
MPTRRTGLLACLFGALLLAPFTARAESPQQILGFALGGSAPAPAQALAVFGLGGLQYAMLEPPSYVEAPAPHYVLKLNQNRTLTIWFDAHGSDRPIYWIELFQQYESSAPPDFAEIVEEIGTIDYKIAGSTGAPMGAVLIALDPALTADRAQAARRHIDMVVRTRPSGPTDDDLFVEPSGGLEYRFKLLSDAFRGRMTAVLTYSNQIDAQHTELIDLAMARAAIGQAQ